MIVAGPAVATPSRARWRPRRRAPGRRLPEGQVPARRCAGATSSAPSTWAWPRAAARAGSASTRAASASPPPGARCPPPPGRRPPTSWPPAAGDQRRAAPPVRALVLLGADPLTTSPTAPWPPRRSRAGHFVVAVTGHPSESVDAHADVVLPCAVAHERPGTTTNIEGRVSRLGQKLVGARLRLARLDDRRRAGRRPRAPTWASLSDSDLADELTAAGAGLRRADPGRARTPTWRTTASWCRCARDADHRADVSPIDPIALPGVESVERQGAPPRVGAGAARPPSEPRGRARAARRPCSPGRGPAGAEPLARPQGRQLLACGWWRAAASTTPAAR